MYRIYAVVTDFGKEVNKNNISSLASSAAFFIFLSLIPILMLICSVMPYTPVTEADLMEVMRKLPDVIAPIAVGMVTEVYDQSPAAISISAVITLWSAAKGILAIMRGLNLISRVKETRNYIMLRIRASFYTLIMLLIIIFFLCIMVFGDLIVRVLLAKLPNVSYFWQFIMNFRFLYVWVFLTVLFSGLYAWLPNKRLKFSLQLPGALFCSVVWSIFSWGFSIYVKHFNTFGIYGSLTTIIIAMLWLYICMFILLTGAELNQYFSPAVRYFYENRKKKREKHF